MKEGEEEGNGGEGQRYKCLEEEEMEELRPQYASHELSCTLCRLTMVFLPVPAVKASHLQPHLSSLRTTHNSTLFVEDCASLVFSIQQQ